jgi:hypothetical protein
MNDSPVFLLNQIKIIKVLIVLVCFNEKNSIFANQEHVRMNIIYNIIAGYFYFFFFTGKR